MTVAIVNLGCGNIGSVRMALERSGIEPLITDDADEIGRADKVILPGVGAAGYAMRQIDKLGLRDVLMQLRQPALGICLGMQLLFERSEEDDTPGLGLIKGQVRAIQPRPDRPVPHMGWSRVELRQQDCGLADGDYVYFAHSYACEGGPATAAVAHYGGEIPAAVRQANWLGAQFHPERSGAAGTRFLESFLG